MSLSIIDKTPPTDHLTTLTLFLRDLKIRTVYPKPLWGETVRTHQDSLAEADAAADVSINTTARSQFVITYASTARGCHLHPTNTTSRWHPVTTSTESGMDDARCENW